MIKAIFQGEELSYNGEITSIGEYDSRVGNFKIWMGKTSHGFIYACYDENDDVDDDPLVLSAKEATNMLRFLPLDKDIKDIHFSKDIEIPKSCKPQVVRCAIELLENEREITNLSKELEEKINSL